MNRAYSVFQVKTIDEEQRIIEGIATTPSTDRVGDVVEPKGAEFKLPIPLLWQHDSRQPIGQVTRAKVSDEGISVVAKFARIAEPGKLKERLDEAWQSVKYGLVRGLSIGFRPTEDPEPINPKDPWGGLRFSKWEWLELSAVSIPANADASIQTIKSFDQASQSAALRATTADQEAGSQPKPGVAGKTVKLKGRDAMPTIRESIASFEAKRAASAAALQKLTDESSEKGETLGEEQKKEFDALEAEISEIDEHIARLKTAEKLNIAAARPVESDPSAPAPKARQPYGSAVRVEAKLEPGIKFARMALSVARAKYLQKEGRYLAPEDIYKSDRRWMDTAPDVAIALKTAVNAGDSTTSGWASEMAYAQNIATEFIEFLRPRTLLGRITGWRNVPFNVRVGGQATGSTGYWVGQGVAITPSALSTTSVSLGVTKVAGLSVITKELAMLSSPSAEAMVRDDLARECQETADVALIDPNNGGQTNIKPASLTYAATARLASGTDYAAFKADWKAITANFYSSNISLDGAVVIMSEQLAEALSLMVTSLGNPQFPGLSATGGSLMGRPVFTTQSAVFTGSPNWSEALILLQPNEVFLADDGTASVEASDQVSVHMDDGTTMKSTATATSTSVVSMFQTESIAIKAVRHINWTKKRSAACQFIRSAAYV